MTKRLLKQTLVIAACAAMLPQTADAFEPVAPTGLKADVNGLVVNLSWEWGNAGNTIFNSGFECDDPSEEGWTVKRGNEEAEFNWMVFDYGEMPDESMAHSGTRSALLMMAMGEEEISPALHQDEWLIARPGNGAVYMDFWYYLHPQLLEDGGFRDFPDHYYVKISRDNGETWTELWDGRWDIQNIDAVRQASLFLGDPTDENTLVAFQALSGEEESLYYLWTIDDVTFMTAEEAAGRRLTASTTPAGFTKPVNMDVRRPFHPTSTSMAVRQLPESEWLNAGNITYRVYLDDEPVGDYVKARSFTDYNYKDPGTHTYRVMAWSEALDQEYDEAEIDVNIGEVVFPEPRNVVADYAEDNEGRYTIIATWEAPDSDIVPDHYNVYVNGKSMGWIDPNEELSVGQAGLYRGAYTFEIEAVYKYPEGESARVSASVFPGTVPTPASLKAERDGNGYILTWEGVPYEGQQPESFFISRGDELIAEGVTECRYVDPESPKANFHYNVHAVYDSGEYSLPASIYCNDREEQALQLPVSADFNFGHLPADWSVSLVDPYDRVKDMYSWRFDNWFEHEFEAEGFVDGFASISGVIASMNKLESYLISPLFAVPADGDVQVSFMKYFEEEKAGPSGPAQFTLEGRAEEDAEWELIANLTEESDGELIYPLSSYAGKNVMLRWGFNGRNSGLAAVDEINIYDAGSGVDFILDENESVDIYSIGGILVRSGVKATEVKNLPAGIYLLRTASGAVFKRIAI